MVSPSPPLGVADKRMPMLFSPTIGATITAGYWFL
jgi:hypothetical protein